MENDVNFQNLIRKTKRSTSNRSSQEIITGIVCVEEGGCLGALDTGQIWNTWR